MNHQDFTTRRGAVDAQDTAATCAGVLTFICNADVGDADWKIYQCSRCQQYFRTAGTPGDTWNRVVTPEWVAEVVRSGRTWQ